MTDNNRGLVDWKAESRRFDGVAHLYDAYRPSYPTRLIEDIISAAGLQKGARLLEIGSGTGLATQLFAQRGYAILCIEPGANLVAYARRRLRDYPQVEFAATPFEDWTEQPGAFALVFSAQAFHWITPETGYTLVASLAAGLIRMIWHTPLLLYGSITWRQDSQR